MRVSSPKCAGRLTQRVAGVLISREREREWEGRPVRPRRRRGARRAPRARRRAAAARRRDAPLVHSETRAHARDQARADCRQPDGRGHGRRQRPPHGGSQSRCGRVRCRVAPRPCRHRRHAVRRVVVAAKVDQGGGGDHAALSSRKETMPELTLLIDSKLGRNRSADGSIFEYPLEPALMVPFDAEATL